MGTADFKEGNGRYSLLRYSVSPANKSVPVSVVFSESLSAVTGTTVRVELSGRFSESVQGSIHGTAAVISGLTACSGLCGTVKMSANVVTAAAMADTLHTAVYGQKDIPAFLGIGDSTDACMRGAKNIPAYLAIADILTAQTAGSKNVPAPFGVSEIVTSLLEATSQTTERTTLQLTIPPGGELRIDSELYRVLLNGENALHTQSGDWIRISRNLLRLTVECASGGRLQGQIIYTERYL